MAQILSLDRNEGPKDGGFRLHPWAVCELKLLSGTEDGASSEVLKATGWLTLEWKVEFGRIRVETLCK